MLRQVAIIGIAMLLPACGSRTPVSADGLAEANLAALEQSVDMESSTIETDKVLRFDRTTVKLNEVPLGETRNVKLRAENVSDEPLVVLDVNTACGCTQVEWSKRPIPPHGETTFRIAFTAEQEGVFFKKVAVRHSAANRPVTFVLEGVVVPKQK